MSGFSETPRKLCWLSYCYCNLAKYKQALTSSRWQVDSRGRSGSCETTARSKLSEQRTAKYVLLPNLNEKLFNGPSLGNREMLNSAILYYLILNNLNLLHAAKNLPSPWLIKVIVLLSYNLWLIVRRFKDFFSRLLASRSLVKFYNLLITISILSWSV